MLVLKRFFRNVAIQFVPGIVMTAVGSQYDLSDCPNGAARWLFGAGISYLVSSGEAEQQNRFACAWKDDD